MSYLMILESFGSTNNSDDIGLVLILLTPVLLVLGFIFFIAGVLRKKQKSKLFKVAAITIIAGGICALVGLGQCGWY